MKRYVHTGKSIESLLLEDVSVPDPGPGEVRVKVKAVSLNSRDLAILDGLYPACYPLIPMSDGAGVIDAVGTGVSNFLPGDKVVSCFYPYWESGPATAENHRVSLGCEVDGMLAQSVVVSKTALLPMPRHLSFAEAACLPGAGLTVWSALFREGKLKPGQTVLIQGTGGVAVFAVQLAHAFGAKVIVISSSDEKIGKVCALGADVGINYLRCADWPEKIMKHTGGLGVDLILELGGAQTLGKSLKCIKTGGRISIIGVLSGLDAMIHIPDILFKHVHMNGITVGHQQDFKCFIQALEHQDIYPVIDKRFTFSESPAAYEFMRNSSYFGKVVIEL